MNIDINSKTYGISSWLSNLTNHNFYFDGVLCRSMEGFLQSLKFEDVELQQRICFLYGNEAQHAGDSSDWKKTQTLFWRGKKYDRDSIEYQNLITNAYNALFLNCSFRALLTRSIGYKLSHSVGNTNKKETVLTTDEFLAQLNRLRNML